MVFVIVGTHSDCLSCTSCALHAASRFQLQWDSMHVAAISASLFTLSANRGLSVYVLVVMQKAKVLHLLQT